MNTLQGSDPWRLTVRRTAHGVILLRAMTWAREAALPETLFGLPVTELGDRALSPTAGPVAGEEILLTCGTPPPEAAWDNRALQVLTLPGGLERVGDYALLNCGALHTLRFDDRVSAWGGGALMNCRSLDTFQITRRDSGQGPGLAYLNDVLSRELDVLITWRDGRRVRLIFPAFYESLEENCPAHHFDYNIQGAGYPYHNCFYEKKLDLRRYDGLWKGFLEAEHEESTALRLAWWRLFYPLELTGEAGEAYLSYLQAHAGQALAWVLSTQGAVGVRFLLERVQPDRAALDHACALAREQRALEALALLLEEGHRRFPAGGRRSFAL